jgi:hypothetical protein
MNSKGQVNSGVEATGISKQGFDKSLIFAPRTSL